MKCCSPARARMKRAAIRKATKAANAGVKIKKANPKKTGAKKAKAKKAPPCKLCGKGK